MKKLGNGVISVGRMERVKVVDVYVTKEKGNYGIEVSINQGIEANIAKHIDIAVGDAFRDFIEKRTKQKKVKR